MNGKTSVGTSNTAVRPADGRRRRISMVNDSSATIYICQGPAALNEGIQLQPNGSFSDEPDITGYMYRGAYNAIASAATSNLSWTEDFIQ